MNGFALENAFARRKKKGLRMEYGSSQSSLPRGQAPWRALANAILLLHIINVDQIQIAQEQLAFGHHWVRPDFAFAAIERTLGWDR